MGTTTSIVAELWALRDGINLCLSLRLVVIEIELDAKVVIDLLEKDGDNPNGNEIIVADYLVKILVFLLRSGGEMKISLRFCSIFT
nr:hypothetical protein CFP56_22688 [Quercus suber]POE55324.1 hypothetical protein CFP56_22689 [Quercus suber]